MMGRRAWVARSVSQVNASRARPCVAREPHNITFATWINTPYKSALQPTVTYIQPPLSICGLHEPHVHQYHNPIRRYPSNIVSRRDFLRAVPKPSHGAKRRAQEYEQKSRSIAYARALFLDNQDCHQLQAQDAESTRR
jgi:hypothetical protein